MSVHDTELYASLLANRNSLANLFASAATVMSFLRKSRRVGPRDVSFPTGDISALDVGGREQAFKPIKINGVKASDCPKCRQLSP